MSKKKTIKKVHEGRIKDEINKLSKVITQVVEMDDLLEQVEAESIKEFEDNVNALTNFTNPMISAQAFNLDGHYKRLLELEKLIDGKLTSNDLTASKELKKSYVSNITEKHTEYYEEADLKLIDTLNDVMKQYNTLSLSDRQQIGYNQSYELIFNPMSNLFR
tara:strand:+ start:16 stop:501 length:486 start_codon:yes stop_codon:yes gene_type:complete